MNDYILYMYKLNIYIYIYIGSVRFLFGLQILLSTTASADFGNGKSLPIIAPRTFGGAFSGQIGAVLGGFVDAGEFLNRPSPRRSGGQVR